MKIRKDDKVVVIAWKNKWTTWKILKVFIKEEKVLVEWVNIVKRNIKKSWNTPGRTIEKEMPMAVSNVMLVCPHTEKATRIGYTKVGEKKFRYSKKAVKLNNLDAAKALI